MNLCNTGAVFEGVMFGLTGAIVIRRSAVLFSGWSPSDHVWCSSLGRIF
jgi:hypothetical protein